VGKKVDIPVVIMGHDAYSAAWAPMIHGLKKYCPDWTIYFITNRLEAPRGCQTIKVGGDLNPAQWSNRVRKGLKQIPAEVFLWMIDDHWVTAPPDLDAVADFVQFVRDGKFSRLRLYPGLNHDFGKPWKRDKRLIVLDPKSPYRTSCKPSLWSRKTFLSLLRRDESPWEFEKWGRHRSKEMKFATTAGWHWFFVTNGSPFGPWPKSPIVKGRWTISARDYCKREGLKIDLKNHPVKQSPFGRNVPEWVLP